MSVLIKTMEMPKNCGECQFCHTENFTQWCCPTGREDIFYDAIPDWCPLDEPKTGEWIDDGCIEKCSQCGERREFPHWDFCPNCGAKMDGDSDG